MSFNLHGYCVFVFNLIVFYNLYINLALTFTICRMIYRKSPKSYQKYGDDNLETKISNDNFDVSFLGHS